jgi:hypothetical protein
VLHHVSLEVAPQNVDRTLELFALLGFERVPAPDPIAAFVSWVERDGTQIHLIHTPEATTPALGQPDFGTSVERLRQAGFEVEGAEELWGEQRAFALLPGGGRVEVLAAPPPASI